MNRMWKEYSVGFIRKNRASSLSIMIAAFISALFLSLLCSLFFNLWNYEIKTTIHEEGNWQGRISGTFDEDTITSIKNFENVKTAKINKELSNEQSVVIDICFQNMRMIYQDMPLIAEQLEIDASAISYHETLLSNYFIHDPQNASPPLLLTFYTAILLIVSFSLILIIHNAFAVSMNARIHQFGIFSSIGATPGQIRLCLLQEAAVLCIVPILIGSIAGIVLSFGSIQLANMLASGVVGRQEAHFTYHPAVFLITILAAVVTVLISAWLPARKLSKRTPLEAIKNTDEFFLKRRRKSHILSLLFGIEGELAGNALKAQKKAMRTSTLSLTLSFMGFTLMLCFLTLSKISTNHTYFERYQNAWDVMITLKDCDIRDFKQTKDLSQEKEINFVVYQKANAICCIPKASMSEDVLRRGGLEALAGNDIRAKGENYLIEAPIIIMDDDGFKDYCQQIGVPADIAGSIVLNRIWDNKNSNFRYKEYIPFLSEEQDTIMIQNAEQTEKSFELPVLTYAKEPPVLREEYDNYALIQVIPLSLWEQMSGVIQDTETDTYIRVLAKDEATLSELNTVETDLSKILNQKYDFEIENRIQEKIDNDNMYNGYMFVIGALCALLAVIGIANVFSNTLGFIRQRKREFARYISIGMTPGSMRKMFYIEAFVIAWRPFFITLPLTVIFVSFMITASYLSPEEFFTEAPIISIHLFILTIFGFVLLAYYIGGRKIMNCNLTDVLRNDNMI